jgi:alkanesulfonate monooxygenase SsuD/methylene tetrahydromethanopterin reductase-like flavin-dependent oxidoreductase (luciferase family)
MARTLRALWSGEPTTYRGEHIVVESVAAALEVGAGMCAVEPQRELVEQFVAGGWRVMAELPDPDAFDAATKLVEPGDMADTVPAGDDPDAVIEGITKYTDAGYQNVAVVQVADDVDGFLAAWEPDIRPKLPWNVSRTSSASRWW